MKKWPFACHDCILLQVSQSFPYALSRNTELFRSSPFFNQDIKRCMGQLDAKSIGVISATVKIIGFRIAAGIKMLHQGLLSNDR